MVDRSIGADGNSYAGMGVEASGLGRQAKGEFGNSYSGTGVVVLRPVQAKGIFGDVSGYFDG